MECKKIKEWVDALVEEQKRLQELKDFSQTIGVMPPVVDYCLRGGIEIVAEILGVPLECESVIAHRYKYVYSFRYRNVRFFQLEKEPLEGV